MTYRDEIYFIRAHISEPALWEGLAEECAELGKEALKVARLMRGENPTPADSNSTLSKAKIEMGDVLNYLELLDILMVDSPSRRIKIGRMYERLQEKERE